MSWPNHGRCLKANDFVTYNFALPGTAGTRCLPDLLRRGCGLITDEAAPLEANDCRERAFSWGVRRRLQCCQGEEDMFDKYLLTAERPVREVIWTVLQHV